MAEDLESYKKKIQSLEETIEELEDDSDGLKKKFRSKDEELTMIQDEVRQHKKSLDELQDTLQSLRTTNDDLSQVVKIKDTSLSFVREVLTATEIQHNNQEMKSKVTNLHSFLVDQWFVFAQKINENLTNEYKQWWLNAFSQWVSIVTKSWLYGKTTVAFVGEFSAGKTSIVNRLLSQDDPNVPLLPVSAEATTAIPTYIAGDDYTTFQFVTPNGQMKGISEDTFRRVSKQVLDEVKGVSTLIQYFVMTYNNPKLKGLSILDTPGFSSNDVEDRERTLEVINECDALFWVFDVNNGTVNRVSMDLMHEKLEKPLYVVINKVDTKSDSEVDKVSTLIQDTLLKGGIKVEDVIRFSSKAPITDILTPIQSIKHFTESEMFLSDFGDEISEIVNKLNERLHKALQAVQSQQKKYRELDEQFVAQLSELHQNCFDVSEIPHWEEHIFHSDKFEMERDEMKKMIDYLQANQEICNTLNTMKDTLNEVSQTVQTVWEDKNHIQNLFDMAKQLQNTYLKLKKSF